MYAKTATFNSMRLEILRNAVVEKANSCVEMFPLLSVVIGKWLPNCAGDATDTQCIEGAFVDMKRCSPA